MARVARHAAIGQRAARSGGAPSAHLVHVILLLEPDGVGEALKDEHEEEIEARLQRQRVEHVDDLLPIIHHPLVLRRAVVGAVRRLGLDLLLLLLAVGLFALALLDDRRHRRHGRHRGAGGEKVEALPGGLTLDALFCQEGRALTRNA